MRISVFGLGYVGIVTAGCLADKGHEVLGVDKNPAKVNMVNSGLAPIVEDQIGTIIQRVVQNGRLRAVIDGAAAVSSADLIFICVGTPGNGNGSLDFKFIKYVCTEIGRALAGSEHYSVVAIRSTILPGVAEEIALPALEQASGKKAGPDFGFCLNPEFLREGSSVYDFWHPPRTVIGELDQRSGDLLAQVYQDFTAPLFRMPINTAAMIKYVDNSFHALKVTFANEIGRVCKKMAVDSRQILEVFVSDQKLNISPKYLKPGFAFGGSCLPKDLRALTYRARQIDVKIPMLEAILASNQEHIRTALTMISQTGSKKIGVLGLAFKAGTDDLRESPMVSLIENLIGKGYEVCIYDKNVHLARLLGANKDYIEREIPHIARYLRTTVAQVVEEADVIVVGHAAEEHRRELQNLNGRHRVIDLSGLTDFNHNPERQVEYEGLCW